MAGESKVGTIQAFLNWIGMEDVTRQAIESALKRHSNLFEIKKKGHERYVALKKSIDLEGNRLELPELAGRFFVHKVPVIGRQ
jgi:hypothetical protein